MAESFIDKAVGVLETGVSKHYYSEADIAQIVSFIEEAAPKGRIVNGNGVLYGKEQREVHELEADLCGKSRSIPICRLSGSIWRRAPPRDHVPTSTPNRDE